MFLTFLATFPLLLSGQDSTPSFRAGARIVEVDIVATRGGKPFSDLKEQDLRLFDNNQLQKIVSFEKAGVGTAAVASEASKSPAATRPARLTYILLDALNTSFSDQIYGREGVTAMLKNLPPGQRIEILALGDKLHVLHGISTDYEQLRSSVAKYEGEQPLNWTPQLNNEPIRMASPAQAYEERRRILDTLQAMAEIANDARPRTGEKRLIWVSSAFPTHFMARLVLATPEDDFHPEVTKAMRTLVAAGVTLYPVSPQGLKPSYAEGMMEMAEQTGGKGFLLSNDVAGLLGSAMDESTEHCLLTFAPGDNRDNGSFHEIRVTTSQRGVDLRYRPGYLAAPAAQP